MNEEKFECVRVEIAKLELKPGDCLVIRAPEEISQNAQNMQAFLNIVMKLRGTIPCKVFCVPHGTEISVVTPPKGTDNVQGT